jgi:hypothetical protein
VTIEVAVLLSTWKPRKPASCRSEPTQPLCQISAADFDAQFELLLGEQGGVSTCEKVPKETSSGAPDFDAQFELLLGEQGGVSTCEKVPKETSSGAPDFDAQFELLLGEQDGVSTCEKNTETDDEFDRKV